MEVVELIQTARAAGLIIVAESDQLVVRGPRRLADLAKRLLANKAEVLRSLGTAGRSSAATIDEVRYWLQLLREDGCLIALVDGQPAITWGPGLDTPGRRRDWIANSAVIRTLLKDDVEG